MGMVLGHRGSDGYDFCYLIAALDASVRGVGHGMEPTGEPIARIVGETPLYAHPAQLADFVIAEWPASVPLALDRETLVRLTSTCFQASLMHEEGRLVRFRMIAAGREELLEHSLPDEWLCLAFEEAKSFNADTARRLSPGTPFRTSLMAVGAGEGEAQVWGIVHTGERWLAPSWSGHAVGRHPLLPVIHVLGPGQIGVYAGQALVASLERGQIQATTTDVFTSDWLPELFKTAREEVKQRIAEEPGSLSVDESLIGLVSQHLVRRAIVLIRSKARGALILFAEPSWLSSMCDSSHGAIAFKYLLQANGARGRYRALLRRLFQELSFRHGWRSDHASTDWQRSLGTEAESIEQIERSVFDLSQLIADLSMVDGAIVLNKRFELIGFGAEVSGQLPCPRVVWQALDVEAKRRTPEPSDAVGTRHRAAYRFVAAHPRGLAIVVSHDGAVRFVANMDGAVVYFEQFLNW